MQAATLYSCCYIDDTKNGMRGVVLAGGKLKKFQSNKRAVSTTLIYDLNSQVKRYLKQFSFSY